MTATEQLRARPSSSSRGLDRCIALVEASGLFDRPFYERASGRRFTAVPDAIRDYLLAGDHRGADANQLFDRAWYPRRYPDVAGEGVDALVHYILRGAVELRDPHPLFDAAFYVATPTGQAGADNPLRHFLHVDAATTRSPHPLFLGDYYSARNPDLAAFDRPIFYHFLEYGGAEIRAFHPLFDVAYYRRFTGPRPGCHNVLAEYLAGPRDRRTHHLFDPGFYLRTNPDVAQAGVPPLLHYVLRGSQEGRAPHAAFDQTWYLSRYPEAALAPDGALGHFVRVGEARGHQPNRYFDGAWYARTHADRLGGLSPIEHYVTIGLAENLQPSPAFDPTYYLEANPDIARSGHAAFDHFMRYGRFERRRVLDPRAKAAAGRFAIVVHLVDLDLLPALAAHLRPLDGPLDILVSVRKSTAALFTAVVEGALPSARVVAVDGRGGDLGALFELAAKVDLSLYTAVCRLPGGKDDAERDVRHHRVLHCLVGHQTNVDMVTDAFRFNDDLWFVGPADLYVSTRRFAEPDASSVTRLFAEMYPQAWPDFDWGFFAGATLWFRPQAIDRLATALARLAAPDADRRSSDALSHGIERVLLLAGAMETKLVGRLAFRGGGSVPELLVSPASEAISQGEPAVVLRRYAGLMADTIRRSLPPPSGAAVAAADEHPDRSVNLVGPLTYLNGLGTSVRAYLALLRDAGVAVNAIDWAQGFERLARTEVELPRTATPAATNIVHINLDVLLAGELLDDGALAELMNGARRNILVFYWELPTLKPEWIALVRRFDEVWCPTTFIRRMVEVACDVPTRLLPPDLGAAMRPAAAADRAAVGLPADRFAFAYFADAGSIIGRKNPEALVRAYVEEFDEAEGACCYVKIHYPEEAGEALGRLRALAGTRGDVVLSDALYDDAAMEVLFQSIDCYVSPHRSEGLGLTIIEAMRNGKPVIATPFGGAADFVDEAHAYPLDFSLVEVGPGCEPYPDTAVWADPSIESIRRQMRRVFAQRSEAALKADAAREAVRRIIIETRAAARALFSADEARAAA